MHILLLHQYYCPPTGAGNDRTRDFAHYFVASGCKVTVITSQARYPEAQKQARVIDEAVAGVRIIAFPIQDPHPHAYIKRLGIYGSFMWSAIKAGKALKDIDCVYACSTPLTAGEAGRQIAAHHAIPFYYETQDVWPDALYGMGIVKSAPLKWILDKVTKRLYLQAKHIIALSDDMVAQICRLGNFQDKITVIPNGTDTHIFQPAEQIQREGDFVYIYAGTIGRANDLMQLIQAIRILSERKVKGIKVRIIGSGNRYTQVRKAATGFEDYIDWEGSMIKTEVALRMQAADAGLVCFAPVKELEANSANKFFDYLASGLPVLINYGGWQAKVLEQNACGLSAPAGDATALAQAMIQMASDPSKARQMGINARKLATQQYDRTDLAKQTLKLIRGTEN
jgi:glycosyltransferase involved in cell wall biosynthesis